MNNNKRVLVAMSGGIDSSMALKLLIDDGFECLACTMNLYDNETAGVSNSRTCCSVDDVLDARSICNKYNVKHYTFNFKELFKEKVINKFVNEVVPKNAFKCKVKPRYRKEESEAEIHMLDDKNAKVTFKEKQRAITKGQSAVFYDGDIVLGGGIIAE